MKKLIILISSCVVSVGILITSIVLLIVNKPKEPESTTKPPIIDDLPTDVLIETNNSVETSFLVGETIPDLKSYFIIYENLEIVEVVDEYITSEIEADKSGLFKVSCSYKESKKEILITITDKIELSSKIESLTLQTNSENVNFKQYFSLKINNEDRVVSDDMITIGVDLSKEGQGYVQCDYQGIFKTILVLVEESEAVDPNPEPPNVNPDDSDNKEDNYIEETKDNVKFVVSENNSFPIGSKIDLNSLCKIFVDGEEVVNPVITFETDLNEYMSGTYSVTAKTIQNFKDYEFNFNIIIEESTEVVVSENEINNLVNVVIADTQGVYKKYINTPSFQNIVMSVDDNKTVDFYNCNVFGLVYFYDSDVENSKITLGYLLKYYYDNTNSNNHSLPKLYVVDINKQIEDLGASTDEESIKTKEILTKIKQKDYISVINNTGLKDETQNGDLWLTGPYYLTVYENSKIKQYAFQEANGTYSYKTYSNYLDYYFKN